MILLLLFSFLAGFVTILAPCIWPVLPIVLFINFRQKRAPKPLGITLGVMLSFTVFTLSVSYLVRMFHLDPNLIRLFAVTIIVFLGLTMIIPALERIFTLSVSKLSNAFGQNANRAPDFCPGLLPVFRLALSGLPVRDQS